VDEFDAVYDVHHGVVGSGGVDNSCREMRWGEVRRRHGGDIPLTYPSTRVISGAKMTRKAITCPKVHVSRPCSPRVGRIHRLRMPQVKLTISHHT
jgi:hypothetical protein